MIWVSGFALAWCAALTVAIVVMYVRLAHVEKQKNIETAPQADPPLKVMNPFPLGIGGLS